MQNITLLTLGELLTHQNETIRRLAGSILKLLQRQQIANSYEKCTCVAGDYAKIHHTTCKGLVKKSL